MVVLVVEEDLLVAVVVEEDVLVVLSAALNGVLEAVRDYVPNEP